MKKYILPLFFVILSGNLFAQKFKVPENYKFETSDDYAPYENDIVQCVEWLVETPVYQYTGKRKEAYAFLLKWLTGSPYVHIEIRQEIVTFMNSSPDFLMIFMGGWAKYSIEEKDFDDKVMGNLAGLESVISFYNQNKGAIPKDKNVEKYIKMKKKGKLKKYVEENI